MPMCYCPHCKMETKVLTKELEENYEIHKTQLTLTSKVVMCSQCNSALWDEELEEENIKKAYAIYRSQRSLLAPEEIRSIRERYGLSQRSFSKVLGWGEITLHRYESGAIQDEAHDGLLKLIAKPQNMLTLFEKNKGRLPSGVAEELDKTLRLLIVGSVEQPPAQLPAVIETHELSELNGYSAPRLDKLEGMMLFFAGADQPCFKTKLNKLMFYADFLHFNEYARSISGSRYLAYHHGPVPENYEVTIETMQYEGAIELSEEVFESYKEGGETVSGENVVAKADWQQAIFTDSEIKCLQYVAAYFKGWSAGKIEKYSHEESAYETTRRPGCISYSKANTLRIALE